MNLRAFLAWALPLAALPAAEPPVVIPPVNPPIVVVPFLPTAITEQTMTIALGNAAPISEYPLVVRPPIAVPAGTRLKFTLNVGGAVTSARWFRNSTPLTATGATLELAVTPGDAATYSAIVNLTAGGTIPSDSVTIIVPTRQSPRLVNTSARVRLGPEQPSFVSGFVVEAAPAGTLLLLRAVGPSLARFGIKDWLAHPRLRVFATDGHEVTPVQNSYLYPALDSAESSTGAFPFTSALFLPVGVGDVGQFYQLPAGAYMAEVSSTDSGSGVVLFEIYEVPIVGR